MKTLPRAPHILMVWGHGHNFGHVARLGAIAQVLRHLGCQLSWAVPSPYASMVRETIASHEAMVSLPATRSNENAIVPRSFADVLTSFGFADEAGLQQTVSSWLQHFAASKIDGVVLDYAPQAQLAAFIAGLPAVQITNGFDAPPPSCPTFGIGVRGPMVERRNDESVARIDAAIARVAKQLGRRIDASLTDLLNYPTRWLDCAPHADPYGPREGIYVGPIGKPGNTVDVEWPDGAASGKRVFVYLRDADQVQTVLAACASLKVAVICAWPAAPTEMVRTSSLQLVVDRPVNLEKLLPGCDAVINYGSSTLVSQCMLAGKPQVMLPTDAEKWLVANRVASVGAGVVLRWPLGRAELPSLMDKVLSDSALKKAALKSAGGVCANLENQASAFVGRVRCPG